MVQWMQCGGRPGGEGVCVSGAARAAGSARDRRGQVSAVEPSTAPALEPSLRTRLRTVVPPQLALGIAMLATGEVINLLLSTISFVLLTRLLSQGDYGAWATALDADAILLGLASLGLPLATVQLVASEGGDRYATSIIVLRLIAATSLIVIVALVALTTGWSAFAVRAALLVAPGFVCAAVVAGLDDLFRANHHFRRVAVLENMARLQFVSAVALLALLTHFGRHASPGTLLLLGIWSATWCVAALIGLLLARGVLTRPSTVTLARLRGAFRATPLLGIIGLVGLFRFRAEVLLLTVLRSNSEAARFAVSTRIFAIAVVVPEITGAVLFPYMLRRGRSAHDDYPARVALIVLGLGVVAGLALGLASPLIVPLVAGSDYRSASGLARAMGLLIPPAFAVSLLTVLLVERGRARFTAVAVAAPSVLAFAFEAAAVQRFGASACVVGAGVALYASFLLLGGRWLLERRRERSDRQPYVAEAADAGD
jgi:O-antigen/teichoic acid export membrane protein